MADSNYMVSGLPPKEWVRLELTKKLTIINAQNKAEDIDIGAVLYGSPTETKGKYIYRTQGINYELVVGKNARIYTNNNANNSDLKKMQNQQLVSYMFVGAIIILFFIAYKLIKEK